jgi:pimeloyl-ACP methyl ester carboxylesterase
MSKEREIAVSVAELEHHLVDIDGSQVSFTVTGAGRPLVVLHGWAGFWQPFLSLFSAELGVKVYGFDMPGWRPSPRLAAEHPLCAWGDMVCRTLEHLGIDEKVAVMGNSVGALSAMLLADRHPQAVDRLLLASPPIALFHRGFKNRLFRTFAGVMDRYPPVLRLVEQTHKNRWYNLWVARWTTFYRFDPVFFDEVIMPSALACDERTSLNQTLSLLEIDFWELIQRTSHPAAIITGDRDPLVPLNQARLMAGLLPDGHLFVLPRAKHGIMLEQAPEFRDIVLDILKRRSLASPAELVPEGMALSGLT